MPEGHTLHRIARDHSKWFVGQKMVVLSPQGRFTAEAEELSGRRLSAAEAFGKHLVYRFSGGKIMHVHLGLYGKFRVHRNAAPEPRGAVRVRMIGAERTFDLNGPNRCELLSKNDFAALLDRLGPDPLRDDADAEKAWERICKSRAAIGTLLLDQSVLAGIGNIYRAEVLFALGIHPNRLGKDVTREEFDDIWDLISRWLQIGVKHNRIITVDRESVDVPLSRLPAKERIQIYKRKNCPRCGGEVDTWELATRKIFACYQCQQ